MDFTIWKYENGYQTDVIPVVYLHSFHGNGEDVWKACHGLKDCPPMVLVSVNNTCTGLDDELSPWPADGVWKGQAPYKGLAEEHLRWMMEECVPQVEAQVSRFIRDTQGSKANGDSSTRTSDANAGGMGKADNAGKAERTNAADGTTDRFLPVIAGYSLAGLFALWATWNSGYFRRVASVSGSLWYPGFTDYIRNNEPKSGCGEKSGPEKAYFSLGDRESRTRHPLMSRVDACTADHTASRPLSNGIPATISTIRSSAWPGPSPGCCAEAGYCRRNLTSTPLWSVGHTPNGSMKGSSVASVTRCELLMLPRGPNTAASSSSSPG